MHPPRIPASRAAAWLAAAAVAAAPASARGADDDSGRLSAAWPFAAFMLQVAAATATVELPGWPRDDAMARIGVGMAAGLLPAAGLLALWGQPCADDEYHAARPSCYLEAVAQGLVVTAVDAAAMFFAMRFVADIPEAARTPPETAAIWSSAWAGGTVVALVLPPLLGESWGEDFWSTAGVFAWLHAALATSMLAAVYASAGPPDDTWVIQLRLPFGP